MADIITGMRGTGGLIRLEIVSPRGEDWVRRHLTTGLPGNGMLTYPRAFANRLIWRAVWEGLEVVDAVTGRLARIPFVQGTLDPVIITRRPRDGPRMTYQDYMRHVAGAAPMPRGAFGRTNG